MASKRPHWVLEFRRVRRGGVGGMGLLRVGILVPLVGVGVALGVVAPDPPDDFLIFMDE